jgi:hypothetical protein
MTDTTEAKDKLEFKHNAAVCVGLTGANEPKGPAPRRSRSKGSSNEWSSSWERFQLHVNQV